MVPGSTLTEKARNLKKWGFDGMGVFVEYGDWNAELKKEILELKANTGVKPCEFCFGGPLYGHLMSDDAGLRTKSRAMYREAAEMCAEIGGAITELEYLYGPQDPLPLFDPYARMNEQQEAGFIEMYKEMCAVIRGSDAYVLVEPINRYEAPFLNNVDHCLEVLKKMNDANAGLLLDMFHLSIEEACIAAKVRDAGDYTKYVHLGDSNRLMPGYGHTDWAAITRALKDAGFTGYMSLECSLTGDAQKTLPEAAAYMQNLIKGA
jgi:sugar phosphate isomerase/epimerase